MKRTLSRIWMMGMAALLVVCPLIVSDSLAFSGIYDDFNDNSTNPDKWTAFITDDKVPSDPQVAETNQRVEVTLPKISSSTNDVFGGGYNSVCKLGGDFNIQVDYTLLFWPQGAAGSQGNGVRVALAAKFDNGDLFHAQRSSFSSDFNGEPREAFLAHFYPFVGGDWVTPFIAAYGNTAGKLKVTRSGPTVTAAYSVDGTNWHQLGSATLGNNTKAQILLSVWSHDHLFNPGDNDIKVAYDNVRINSGGLNCPGTIVFIDVKPGSTVNPVNLGDQGLLPVAILGRADFDVTLIEPDSINIRGVGLLAPHGKKPKWMYSYEDVDGDGYLDMMTHFSVPALVADGVLTDGTAALTVEGHLIYGLNYTIQGTDAITIVPK